MDLRLLQYFIAITAAGSLNTAARTLHVAQPSLTRQLRRLERDLGFELFHRTSRGLDLTPAGVAFLPVAERLVGRAAQAAAHARAIAGGTVQNLTAVAAPTTVADIVAPFIVRAGPDGVVGNVVEAMPEDVYSVVSGGEADFAVGTRIPPADLRSEVVGRAFLWAQVPPEHRFAGREYVPVDELLTEPLVVMSRGHGVRQLFDAAAARDGLSYTPATEAEIASVAQALAAAGRGVSVVSDDARFGLESLPIRTSEGDLTVTLFGVWDPVHHASARIRAVLSELGDFMVELYGEAAAP